MTKKRILVVEDDPAIRGGIVDALRFAGYDTFEAATGHEGMTRARGLECDLVLLDLVLPGPGGLEILRELRLARPTLPVIILTALGDEKDRVAGLRLGADDYVVKPFGVNELLARVEAVLRRTPGRPLDLKEVKLPCGVADLSSGQARFNDGQSVELTPKEVELLRYLACNGGRVIGREEVLMRVWGIAAKGVTTRTIDMHITRLRAKLRDGEGTRQLIRTVRGRGYAFGEIGAMA